MIHGVGSAWFQFEFSHDSDFAPDVNEYKRNFPLDHIEKLWDVSFKEIKIYFLIDINNFKLTIDELLYEKNDYCAVHSCTFGELCLRLISMNIEKSCHFFEFLELVAERFQEKAPYPNDPLDYVFIEFIEKYIKGFRQVKKKPFSFP